MSTDTILATIFVSFVFPVIGYMAFPDSLATLSTRIKKAITPKPTFAEIKEFGYELYYTLTSMEKNYTVEQIRSGSYTDMKIDDYGHIASVFFNLHSQKSFIDEGGIPGYNELPPAEQEDVMEACVLGFIEGLKAYDNKDTMINNAVQKAVKKSDAYSDAKAELTRSPVDKWDDNFAELKEIVS